MTLCVVVVLRRHRRQVTKLSSFYLFFVFFASRPGHIVRPIATNEGSKRVFLRNEVPLAWDATTGGGKKLTCYVKIEASKVSRGEMWTVGFSPHPTRNFWTVATSQVS